MEKEEVARRTSQSGGGAAEQGARGARDRGRSETTSRRPCTRPLEEDRRRHGRGRGQGSRVRRGAPPASEPCVCRGGPNPRAPASPAYTHVPEHRRAGQRLRRSPAAIRPGPPPAPPAGGGTDRSQTGVGRRHRPRLANLEAWRGRRGRAAARRAAARDVGRAWLDRTRAVPSDWDALTRARGEAEGGAGVGDMHEPDARRA